MAEQLEHLAEELSCIREELQEKQDEINHLEGRKQQLLDTLKKEYKVGSVEAAEALLEKLSVEIDNQEEEIKVAVKELKEKVEAIESAD